MVPAPDISPEISFRTARSGGKGGQNVNKVETMVEGSFHVESSVRLSDSQKALVSRKLRNRINASGELQTRSQVHRSQLSNKLEVIRKMNEMVSRALTRQKVRVSTKPSFSSVTRRLESKKIASQHKQNRQKFRQPE